MWDPYKFEKRVLENGLTLYVQTWDRPWIKVGIMVHSGGLEDPLGKEGTAHFVEHLVSQNVRGLNYYQIRGLFKDRGGSIDTGETSSMKTQYEFAFPMNTEITIGQVLEVVGTMLLDSKLENFLEQERRAILGEYGQRVSSDWIYDTVEKMRSVIFAGCRLERFVSPLGSKATIAAISQQDVQEFFDKHYTPANMSIVVVGGMTAKECCSAFSNSPFGLKKPGVRTPIPPPFVPVQPKEHRKILRMSELGKTPDNTSSVQTFAALPGNLSHQAVRRVCPILWEILLKEIRERDGVSYGLNAGFEKYPEAYEFRISGEISWDAVDSIEARLTDCIEKASRDRSRIAQEINREIQSYKITDKNADQILNGSMSELERWHNINTLAEDLDETMALTVEAVEEVFSHLTPERRFTILQYP